MINYKMTSRCLFTAFISFSALMMVSTGDTNTTTATQQKQNLTLYYESLCPDSVDFVINQLYPTYLGLSSYLRVQLVPFGKAFLNDTHFICRHGQMECVADKVHGCAFKKVANESAVMAFLNCTMATYRKDNTTDYPTQQCAEKSGILYETINSCISNDQEALTYIREFQRETTALKPKLDFIPLLVFNNEYPTNDTKEELDNLKKFTCGKFNGTKIDFCSSGAASFLGTLALVAASFLVLLTAY